MKHCNCSTQLGHHLSTGNRLAVTIKHGKLEIEYEAYSSDSSFLEDIEIQFCPSCGRDITGDKPSEVDEMTLQEIYLKCEQHDVKDYQHMSIVNLTTLVKRLLAKEREENEIV